MIDFIVVVIVVVLDIAGVHHAIFASFSPRDNFFFGEVNKQKKKKKKKKKLKSHVTNNNYTGMLIY